MTDVQTTLQRSRHLSSIVCGMTALLLFTLVPVDLIAGPLVLPNSEAQTTAAVRGGEDLSADLLKRAGRQLAGIAARLNPAVVNIDSSRDSRSGQIDETGSGVIMKFPGSSGVVIVTNRHVVADARLNQIEIRLHDGRIINPFEKLEDPFSDLAVLKIQDPGIEPALFGDSDNLDIGHFVLALGSPFGLQQSVTLGIISAKGRRSLELPGRQLINQDFLQTDAAINPGNSGGPLVDLDGRIVGINTAIASQGGGNEGIAFSIPSNLARFIVTQLLEHGRVQRGYLGVQLDENFDSEAASRYSLTRKYGARVVRVSDRTPAAQAGLLPDDIILNFDGIDIEDENDLINRVSLTPVNKRVRIVILRSGEQKTLFVVLAEKPSGQSRLPEGISHPLPVTDNPIGMAAPRSQVRPAAYRATGLSVLEMNNGFRVQLGYSSRQAGLLVSALPADAGTDESQLQLYDVIEEVARKPVSTPDELDAVLAELADQSEILVRVCRVVDGRPQQRLVVWKR